MNEYVLNNKDLPFYTIEILKRQGCPALLPCGVVQENEEFLFYPDIKGAMPAIEFLRPQSRLMGDFTRLLSLLRKVLESLLVCEDWWLGDEVLSLKLSDLYIKENRVLFLLKPSEESFPLRFSKLLQEAFGNFSQIDTAFLQNIYDRLSETEKSDKEGLIKLFTQLEIQLEN